MTLVEMTGTRIAKKKSFPIGGVLVVMCPESNRFLPDNVARGTDNRPAKPEADAKTTHRNHEETKH